MAPDGEPPGATDLYSPLRRLQEQRARDDRHDLPIWALLAMGVALFFAAAVIGLSTGLVQGRSAAVPLACRDALARRVEAEAGILALPHTTRGTTNSAASLINVEVDRARRDALGLHTAANDAVNATCR